MPRLTVDDEILALFISGRFDRAKSLLRS